ncbi:HAD family hydrolase [Porphyromonas levii]|uniref:HAD family hydrolase n=1 Tax=Porphyromonas levii TaxID=28114 RepID=UPI001BA5E791|nr:HAD family hydrolase [Porphyromonas levii]MBR8803430.1 Phosphoglycolate phosphatase [Porphyromonas levii]
MKSIIFDLDLTLVDTSSLEEGRRRREWQMVYSLIPSTSLYDGMREVLDIIQKNNLKVAIVSTSPRTYIEKIATYHNIPVQHIIGYHDVKPIKPHPAPMLKAIELMGVSAQDAVSFGDRVIDIQASNSAGIESVACFWGTKESGQLVKSEYSHAILHPREIITLIR